MGENSVLVWFRYNSKAVEKIKGERKHVEHGLCLRRREESDLLNH
jgi:hypothetical protein